MRRAGLLTWAVENDLWEGGFVAIAGVDEVGRGALAGPVVAAAVMLSRDSGLEGVDDSKRLRPRERERLFQQIQRRAAGVGVGVIDASVIDRMNIRRSTLLAMEDAIRQLPRVPDYVLIDGIDGVTLPITQRALVGGDRLAPSIAAASIIAKVTRDRLMEDYHRQFPEYDFAAHKGYGTAIHLHALRRLGPCSIHRTTFRGVTGTPLHHG